MSKILFSFSNRSIDSGLGVIRIITGLLMFYHGLEIFKTETMQNYLTWEVIKTLPFPEFMVYLGKAIELVTGLFFIFGFLTRISALFMAVNMLFICFYIGSGKFYYEDQHPFLFAILALVYFFKGPAGFGLDNLISKSDKNE
ncbi:MAG: DoxX family protein [Bacteroidales bacterium]